MEETIRRLTPMAFVADVARSIAYYERLGFTVGNTVTSDDSGGLTWAWLFSGSAHLMLAKASDPVAADQQAVLFYLYVDDVAATRESLLGAGLSPGPISTPFYAPKGEFRLTDPDGYCLMVTHV